MINKITTSEATHQRPGKATIFPRGPSRNDTCKLSWGAPIFMLVRRGHWCYCDPTSQCCHHSLLIYSYNSLADLHDRYTVDKRWVFA